MVSFLACWLPFFLLYPVISLCGPRCENPATGLLLQLFTYTGWANSALNPVIYTVFNPEFRNAFHKIIHFHKYTPFHKLQVSSTYKIRDKKRVTQMFACF